MATIAEYPDDPKYTIKTVCTQTGILPVTLRAWERRHDVLAPQRAENHYRLYSERDVAILRWIKSRIDNGITISNAVNELRELRQKGLWPEAIPVAPKMSDHKTKGDAKRYSHRLYEALIRHDEYEAGVLLQEIHKIFDLRTICTDIITPSLVEIGEAWYRGEIRVTTEHFACSFLRGRLLSLMQTFPCRRNSNFLLVGCAPGEQHEIGAIMFTVLLRSNCFQVEYLGPDVPLEDLVDYAKYEHPAAVILTASTDISALEMKHLNDQLCHLKRPPAFAYAGRAFMVNPNLRHTIPGVYLGDTLEQGIECIQSLLMGEHSARSSKEKTDG
jgi:MerR family transcriptional regulator, light-induced transcriptional regulator